MYLQFTDGDILQCPQCKENYLHQRKVEVFERKEDEERGICVVVTRNNVEMDTSMEGNPSSRRQGICIHFECEICNAHPVMFIAQHKGFTLMNIFPRSAVYLEEDLDYLEPPDQDSGDEVLPHHTDFCFDLTFPK